MAGRAIDFWRQMDKKDIAPPATPANMNQPRKGGSWLGPSSPPPGPSIHVRHPSSPTSPVISIATIPKWRERQQEREKAISPSSSFTSTVKTPPASPSPSSSSSSSTSTIPSRPSSSSAKELKRTVSSPSVSRSLTSIPSVSLTPAKSTSRPTSPTTPITTGTSTSPNTPHPPHIARSTSGPIHNMSSSSSSSSSSPNIYGKPTLVGTSSATHNNSNSSNNSNSTTVAEDEEKIRLRSEVTELTQYVGRLKDEITTKEGKIHSQETELMSQLDREMTRSKQLENELEEARRALRRLQEQQETANKILERQNSTRTAPATTATTASTAATTKDGKDNNNSSSTRDKSLTVKRSKRTLRTKLEEAVLRKKDKDNIEGDYTDDDEIIEEAYQVVDADEPQQEKRPEKEDRKLTRHRRSESISKFADLEKEYILTREEKKASKHINDGGSYKPEKRKSASFLSLRPSSRPSSSVSTSPSMSFLDDDESVFVFPSVPPPGEPAGGSHRSGKLGSDRYGRMSMSLFDARSSFDSETLSAGDDTLGGSDVDSDFSSGDEDPDATGGDDDRVTNSSSSPSSPAFSDKQGESNSKKLTKGRRFTVLPQRSTATSASSSGAAGDRLSVTINPLLNARNSAKLSSSSSGGSSSRGLGRTTSSESISSMMAGSVLSSLGGAGGSSHLQKVMSLEKAGSRSAGSSPITDKPIGSGRKTLSSAQGKALQEELREQGEADASSGSVVAGKKKNKLAGRLRSMFGGGGGKSSSRGGSLGGQQDTPFSWEDIDITEDDIVGIDTDDLLELLDRIAVQKKKEKSHHKISDSSSKASSASLRGREIPVFGVPLSNFSEIPDFLSESFGFLEEHVSFVPNLFVHIVDERDVNVLKTQLDASGCNRDHLQQQDPHVVAHAVLKWLNDLPERLLTRAESPHFLWVQEVENESFRVSLFRSLLWRLPDSNRHVLAFLIKSLRKFCDNPDITLLTSSRLGLIFGPALLHGSEHGKSAQVVKKFIEDYRYVFMDTEPDIRYLLKDGKQIVRWATVDRLVERLVDPLYRDETFLDVLFLTNDYFIENAELLKKLLQWYTRCKDHERKTYKVELLRRIMVVLKWWITRHAGGRLHPDKDKDFETTLSDFVLERSKAKDPDVIVLREFLEILRSGASSGPGSTFSLSSSSSSSSLNPPFFSDSPSTSSSISSSPSPPSLDSPLASSASPLSSSPLITVTPSSSSASSSSSSPIVAALTRSSSKTIGLTSALSESSKSPHLRSANSPSTSSSSSHAAAAGGGGSDLLDIEAEEIARTITTIDHEALCLITPNELLKKNFTAKNRSPQFHAMIDKFNEWSMWGVSEVLARSHVADRAQTLTHVIEVAHMCLSHNNFNACCAIISGISNPAIQRLKLTWDRVSRKTNAKYEEMTEIFDMSNNCRNYRDLLRTKRAPIVPYLALFPKDITPLEETPTYIEGDAKAVNFDKLRTLYRIVHDLVLYQNNKYPWPVNRDLVARLKVLNNVMTDDQAYDRSLVIEPKEERKGNG